MTAATITQAQGKGLRHQSGLFATIRHFCEQLYVAHGGWLFGARKDAAQQAAPHATASPRAPFQPRRG